jgi:hypothetical protein
VADLGGRPVLVVGHRLDLLGQCAACRTDQQ